jgi:hypothetical protein
MAETGVEPSNSGAAKDELGPATAPGVTNDGTWAAANRARHKQSIDNLRKVRCMGKLEVLTLYMITWPKKSYIRFQRCT